MTPFDWSPYLIGGATRPDAISGLDPRMQNALRGFLQAAPQGLQIYSAYRSPELQAELYQNALAKYGDEATARKWVAPPGRSQHNHGRAVDLKWNGVRLDRAPQHIQDEVKALAVKYGLDVPMEWEPWQVELAGARDGTTPAYAENQNTPAGPEPRPQNALAAMGYNPTRLDPAAFMSQRRFS